MNTPVSFEISKLLKEKEFDEPCYYYYYNDKLNVSSKDNWNNFNGYSAPTIAEVVMWLYEKHGIWVSVDNLIDGNFYFSHRDAKASNYASRKGCNEYGYKTPVEAYEAVIEYTLENLIK